MSNLGIQQLPAVMHPVVRYNCLHITLLSTYGKPAQLYLVPAEAIDDSGHGHGVVFTRPSHCTNITCLEMRKPNKKQS